MSNLNELNKIVCVCGCVCVYVCVCVCVCAEKVVTSRKENGLAMQCGLLLLVMVMQSTVTLALTLRHIAPREVNASYLVNLYTHPYLSSGSLTANHP